MNLILEKNKYEIYYWRIKNNLEIINDEIEIVSSTSTGYGKSIYIEKELENEYNEEIKKSILNFNWYDFKKLKKNYILFKLNVFFFHLNNCNYKFYIINLISFLIIKVYYLTLIIPEII